MKFVISLAALAVCLAVLAGQLWSPRAGHAPALHATVTAAE